MANDYDIETLKLYYGGDNSIQDYFLEPNDLDKKDLDELFQQQKKFIESLRIT